ncbi:short-chain dehydrogenase TIC 32, chloroplastic isoform X2 [Carica papaya]|uniref:short-chain dehydrogenase TIC 32, chloroplastic isoform X2 n=1 Tax=Carica papaya TaxID=3649 RepID=UPI000B8CE6F9|nr:short-chain dehydrogenase TIC 32, chloroplastic isoform X2 [Carica papaya]
MGELWKALHFLCSMEFWRMGVLWTISIVMSYLQLLMRRLFSPSSSPCCSCSPPKTNCIRPVCVITGATSGLGAAAAFELSSKGFYVVLAGRSPHLLLKTMEDIKSRNKDAHLKALQVDMSSSQSILKFRNSLQEWLCDSDLHSSIQLLINNAGILATSSRLTTEGYDQMLATNYIGAFSLTTLLLPLLQNSPVPSRIVNVTSFTHRYVFDVKVDKEAVSGKYFLRSKQYPCARIYECSKLCLLLFSYELHRQLGMMDKPHCISVVAADPGLAETNIMREVPSYISRAAFMVLKCVGLLQSSNKAVRSILDAALAPPEISGVYFFGGNGRTINSSSLSHNTRLAAELWKTSFDLFMESQLPLDETFTSDDKPCIIPGNTKVRLHMQ